MSEPNEITGSVVAGKYKIKRRIGQGGMGAVYEGEHIEIGKRVAIKVIEHSGSHSAELASRFKREARAASAVESEHIVHVFDVGTDEKIGLYMVMEFLSGEDLASRLEKHGGKLPVDEVVNISMQAARGLAKAHAAGVVHRDLKPANLFLTTREDGSVCVKILDFGISKLVRADETGKSGSSALTREGAVMGTPMYMSPQQAQGMTLDLRTDIWSLGAVIYQALTGATPWESRDTYEQMIIQIVTQRPKPVAEIAPNVSDALARVVDATLQHDLEARTPDASTLARQLAEAAKLPAPPTSARSTDATIAAAGPPGSGPPVSVRAQQTQVTPPPTGVGVVVARTQSDSEPKKKSVAMLVGIAGVVAATAAVIAGVMLGGKQEPKTSGNGLVPAETSLVAAGSSSATSPSASTSAASTTTLLPLAIDTASAAASASAPPSASHGVRPPTTAISTKPMAKPAGAPPTATTATGQRPGQYGAAGVSTAY